MADIVAHSSNLGSLGSLVYFKTPRESKDIQWPIPIFIVDKSGSMGQWSRRIINKIIPNTLETIGYPKKGKVHLITFEQKTRHHKTTIDGLRSIDASCGGGTCICGAIRTLNSVLETIADSPLTIYIISDGEIYDKENALKYISTIHQTRRNVIRTGYCRLETSQFSTPDTRVLACFAVLNNIGAPTGITVKARGEETEANVANSIYSELSNITIPIGTILETESNVLKHLPNDAPLSRMVLPNNHDVIFFLSNPEETVECGGQKMSLIQNEDVLSDPRGLETLLHVIDTRIRHLRVGGSPRMHREADELIECIDVIDKTLTLSQKLTIKAAERLKRLKRPALRKYKQTLLAMRELGNNRNVSELTDKQQAEFLSKKAISISLAKRAKKIDSDLDYDGLCRDALQRLRGTAKFQEPLSVGRGPVSIMENSSFCSCDTFYEIMNTAYEAADAELSDYVIDGLLTIIGGVGVAFRSKHTDLTDPWQMHVQNVYCGDHYLSECDLQTARAIDKNITYPGFGSEAIITGVVPLFTIDNNSYDTYMSKLIEIAQLQASVALRGRLARIPGDIPARIAAVLVGICDQIGPTNSTTEPQRRIIGELYRTAVSWCQRNPNKYSKVVEALKKKNPTGWLSGEEGYDVSSSLKPRFMFLASKDCEEIRTDLQKGQRVMRALYTLHIYCECRRFFRNDTKARKSEIERLLGVDLKNKGVAVGERFKADKEYDLTATVNYSNAHELLANSSWCQDPLRFASILRCLYNEQRVDRRTLDRGKSESDALTKVAESENEVNMTRDSNVVPRAVNVSEAYGVCDDKLLRLTAAIEALSCASEDERVDKKMHVSLGPDYGDFNACRKYLEKVHDQRYRLDYEDRLIEKKTYEQNHRDEIHINTDVECQSLDLFAESLNRKVTITKLTRVSDSGKSLAKESDVLFYEEGNSSNFTKLVEKLLENDDVPFRLEKIWMIITGHYPSPSLKVAWAKGNIVRRNLNKFKKVINTLDPQTWPKICDFVDRNKIHVYRKEKLNRHGHGESKPSYWALGYTSIRDMLNKLGWEQILSYSNQHTKCCG